MLFRGLLKYEWKLATGRLNPKGDWLCLSMVGEFTVVFDIYIRIFLFYSTKYLWLFYIFHIFTSIVKF